MQARDWYGDGSLYVVDLPLACCALETQAAAGDRPGVDPADIPDGAKVVVTLSGTLTAPVVPAIRHALDSIPGTPTVVAFGACACIGGPYWDSYPVLRGGEELVHIDHFLAGCPPPPAAIEAYLDEVRRG